MVDIPRMSSLTRKVRCTGFIIADRLALASNEESAHSLGGVPAVDPLIQIVGMGRPIGIPCERLERAVIERRVGARRLPRLRACCSLRSAKPGSGELPRHERIGRGTP